MPETRRKLEAGKLYFFVVRTRLRVLDSHIPRVFKDSSIYLREDETSTSSKAVILRVPTHGKIGIWHETTAWSGARVQTHIISCTHNDKYTHTADRKPRSSRITPKQYVPSLSPVEKTLPLSRVFRNFPYSLTLRHFSYGLPCISPSSKNTYRPHICAKLLSSLFQAMAVI